MYRQIDFYTIIFDYYFSLSSDYNELSIMQSKHW